MKAASRAPGPRCRRQGGERELHCAGTERAAAAVSVSVSYPRAPGGAAPAPAPLPAPGLPLSLPPSLPGRLAGSLACSPPPRPGALESAEFAEREPFKFSALGCLERGFLARKKDGGEREEETPAAAAGPGAPGAPLPPRCAQTRARGSGRANVGGQTPVLGRVCLSEPGSSRLFCGESRCFCSLRGGRGGLGVGCAVSPAHIRFRPAWPGCN